MENQTVLFDNGVHKNILLEDFGHGEMVQANVHFIVDSGEGMILDPGGHKVFKHLLQEIGVLIGIDNLKYILFSHQDPDIVAAANGWLMTTKATALASKLWIRFIPHFGVDRLVVDRIKPIDDSGTIVRLGQSDLYIIPAHWLHSPGNFQVYDPVSKILYSGDLGASLGQDYIFVENFEEHIKYMEGFHKRYIASSRALKNWAKMVRLLDIEMIAPQHGAIFKGKDMVNKFINWVENLQTGVDIMDDVYKIPTTRFEG
ncbi:MBL fold metallo-hydrolase [Venenivibrio stagnispumantis]|uniref:Metallo-beta-lactamase superfamily protein n=1 Tax=Venenivibrio stagnispumantis TaxID=407998 RepID=A0AA45WM84_9AQUI|nr:MBL fold metallo-hydrolase [Venenivibrio stagnispumantis]MCW4572816.1 MBL fold metallo-hydrolase [Venenivibrio stagnispumantis]SMP13707.1 Metallo-beta-lactamase superfamily protein [Venenivibrio stagnispumantis]